MDHLAIAVGLERLITMVRVLSPSSAITQTTASTLYRLSTEGPKRLSDLAASEGVTQPAMTQLVSRLERQGLARRDGDPTDRRVVMVHITADGRRLLRERQAYRAGQLSRLLAALPPEDERAIAAALPALARLTDLAGPSGSAPTSPAAPA